MNIDGVFEGGGIKGLAHLGAIEVMEKAGYRWERLAGTSAGSIVAALLAVGYNAKEIIQLMLEFPFEKIEQKTPLSRLPLLGPWLSLTFLNGVYKLTVLEKWMKDVLWKKGKYSFGDLPENKLKIVTTDLSKNRMTILPDDLPLYGVNPKTFPISRAVLMSCSVPFIFVPNHIRGNTIVDGAILSNYPIWIFDSEGLPRWPTIGFRLSGPEFVPQSEKIKGPVKTMFALARTMMEAHDKRYIEKAAVARTVFIKGIEIGITDFRLDFERKLQLIELGRTAAHRFLDDWDFTQYIKSYRIH
jgi:NTE family protein